MWKGLRDPRVWREWIAQMEALWKSVRTGRNNGGCVGSGWIEGASVSRKFRVTGNRGRVTFGMPGEVRVKVRQWRQAAYGICDRQLATRAERR